MATLFPCPECGATLQANRQAYKHAVHCLNIPDRGAEQVIKLVAQRQDEYSRRVIILMRASMEGGE